MARKSPWWWNCCARFDEETNINGPSGCESAGAHVVYGVVGHKCHAKMLLIVRREAAGRKQAVTLRRYAHLGTGNYHPRTARLYTDFGLLTADEKICEDVHHVFQLLTGTAGTIRAEPSLAVAVHACTPTWSSIFAPRHAMRGRASGPASSPR